MKNLTFIFLAAVMLSSCLYTKNAAIRKFCTNDTTSYIYRDTIRDTITVPGQTLTTNFNCDSLAQVLDQLNANNSHLLDSLGYLTLYADSVGSILVKRLPNGNFKFKAKTNPQTIPYQKPIERVIKIPCNCPPPPQPGIWLTIKNLAANICLYIVLGAILVWVVRSFINRASR